MEIAIKIMVIYIFIYGVILLLVKAAKLRKKWHDIFEDELRKDRE
jgi:uncharacterized membrane protein YhaH (DUF805 family)